jgi:hypothetical protein
MWTNINGIADARALDRPRFLVSHESPRRPGGGARIVYAIRVEGLEPATPEPLVRADVGEMLAALQALAGAEVS